MCNLSDLIEERGIEEGIKALIETCKELGHSKIIIQEKITEKFSLTQEAAETLIEKYWM